MTQKVVTNDEAVTGSNFFVVAIFGTFEMYVTNIRGTFVENLKKSFFFLYSLTAISLITVQLS
jgi:hypothetical protein